MLVPLDHAFLNLQADRIIHLVPSGDVVCLIDLPLVDAQAQPARLRLGTPCCSTVPLLLGHFTITLELRLDLVGGTALRLGPHLVLGELLDLRQLFGNACVDHGVPVVRRQVLARRQRVHSDRPVHHLRLKLKLFLAPRNDNFCIILSPIGLFVGFH